MKWYLARLTAESWMASAWQADTIWGHLCWGLRYHHGEDALLQFIDAYEQGAPPLLVSNGFPDDLLPRPIVPEPAPDSHKNLAERRQEFRDRKSAKDIKFLTREEFAQAIQGQQFVPSRKEKIETTVVTLKNQISRLTSTTGAGGQLFPFEQYRWASISIYLKVADDFVDRARELFQHLAQSGYGKRKSVGYGQVKLEAFDQFPGFPGPADANGFVTLSNFVPASQDPTSGYWAVIVKYGKLGEEFATGENPFKKPLLMFTEGSTFHDSLCREYYGRLVRGLSPIHIDKVVQYGFALPVPMKLTLTQAAGETKKMR
jgi:CRISPR-associated protein Csm4